MDIKPLGLQHYGRQLLDSSVEDAQDLFEQPPDMSASEHRARLDEMILEKSTYHNVSLSKPEHAFQVVYDEAIASINDELEGLTGESNSIQAAFDAGIDFSPEATAERIVSFATSFFGRFQEQNPDQSRAESLDEFVDIISNAIDTGFGEARDFLSELNVLEGEIESNIDKTYDLVQDGLESFRENAIDDADELLLE